VAKVLVAHGYPDRYAEGAELVDLRQALSGHLYDRTGRPCAPASGLARARRPSLIGPLSLLDLLSIARSEAAARSVQGDRRVIAKASGRPPWTREAAAADCRHTEGRPRPQPSVGRPDHPHGTHVASRDRDNRLRRAWGSLASMNGRRVHRSGRRDITAHVLHQSVSTRPAPSMARSRVTSGSASAIAVATMSRSHGSRRRPRSMRAWASATSRSTGCRSTAGERSKPSRSRPSSAAPRVRLVWVTYHRSIRVAIETTIPPLASARARTSRAAGDS
jgi:hypothetical protein